jgi:hypothetical protein
MRPISQPRFTARRAAQEMEAQRRQRKELREEDTYKHFFERAGIAAAIIALVGTFLAYGASRSAHFRRLADLHLMSPTLHIGSGCTMMEGSADFVRYCDDTQISVAQLKPEPAVE